MTRRENEFNVLWETTMPDLQAFASKRMLVLILSRRTIWDAIVLGEI